MACELVIFDCDGVLVDSEMISLAVLREFISRSGVDIAEDDARRLFLGVSLKTTCGILAEDFGLALNGAQLAEMREMLYARFRRDLAAIPNVGAMIDRLGRPYCVASSSQEERIRLSLRKTGLINRFEPHIFSATMVSKGKPAPDLFLHAAREMGTAPGDCVVIEDSPAGITAAKRAGMRVFAFTGAAHAETADHQELIKSLEPDLIFNDMLELPSLVAGISTGGRKE